MLKRRWASLTGVAVLVVVLVLVVLGLSGCFAGSGDTGEAPSNDAPHAPSITARHHGFRHTPADPNRTGSCNSGLFGFQWGVHGPWPMALGVMRERG